EIARFEKLEKTELKSLVAAIRAHRDLAERLDLINSIDGIGLRTAVAILVRMPEIGRITGKKPPRLPASLPMMTTAVTMSACGTLKAAASACALPSTKPHCQQPSAGTRS